MTGFLTDYKGDTYALPVLLDWEVQHAMGEPCDAFCVRFLFETEMEAILQGAVRFRGEYAGETVFVGVVDEYEINFSGDGGTVTLQGRGLAALLLDNEAEAAEYYGASLQFILERHVYPWGISQVETGGSMYAPLFTVDSGASQWGVLTEFAWFCGGVRPRFSKEGVLLLREQEGARRLLAGTAVLGATLRDTRYGVISQVLVKNKSWGLSATVHNEAFEAMGGQCRRVLSVPRNTGYDAMRSTGLYQIQESQREQRLLTVDVAACFAAFPGDTLALDIQELGIRGSFTVYETRCWADASGAGTSITVTL